MKKTSYILSVLLITAFSACQNSDLRESEVAPAPDYLIFGHFYGFCVGEKCIEIFKIDNKHLFEDKKDKYPHSDTIYEGVFEQVSDAKYEKVKELINTFPEELLNEKNIVIGSPDAGDWGGYYVEYSYKGVKKFWLIDKMKSNIPGYLHDFTDKMNEKIKEISD